MAEIDSLIHALEETHIAQVIGIPHDDARARYSSRSNTVRNWREFEDAIEDYSAYHHEQCVAPGARLPRTEALGKGKEIIEQAYRRRRSDIVGAFTDAKHSTNGGMNSILDVIADGLKMESIMRYTRDQFESRVAPNDWDEKVEIVRQFLHRFGPLLGDTIDRNRPERYAERHEELIRAFSDGLNQMSSVFRRL